MIPFELEVKLSLQSDLHIAGVGRTAVLIDRCIELDSRKRPYIPSTTFKGRVRAHYERLLSALGYDLKGCKPPAPDTICNDPANLCPVCQLFGSPVQQSRLEFTSLRPEDRATPTTRIGIGVNRLLNTVEQGRLFFYEAAPHAQLSAFTGSVRGWATKTEIAYLIAAMKMITHFGGQKARGLGRVSVQPQRLWLCEDGQWHEQNLDHLLNEHWQEGPR